MDNKKILKLASIVVGWISLIIFLIMFLLILNWFFNITPYQRLEGLPLIGGIFVGPIGIILGLVSMGILPNKIGKIGAIANLVLFIVPWVYMLCFGI